MSGTAKCTRCGLAPEEGKMVFVGLSFGPILKVENAREGSHHKYLVRVGWVGEDEKVTEEPCCLLSDKAK